MSFHPAEFEIVHQDYDRGYHSFVGVRRRNGGDPRFVLPPGFNQFPAGDEEEVSRYFFGLFRALRHFRDFHVNKKPFPQSDFEGEEGMEVKVKRSEPAMLYTKIQILEDVIERFDELRIYNVLYRNRRTDEIDYSQIHRYLDRAIYQNDVPYVEEMRLSKPMIEMSITALVRMFCFIYAEIAPRVGEDLNPEIRAEAARFKSRHLSPDSHLFREVETHRRTIDRLRYILDEIDREVAHRGADFWYFFEAVETFLYGRLSDNDDGISWGITKFAPVWEDMCITWMHRHRWDEVCYADTERFSNTQIGGHRLYRNEDFDPPFAVELGGHKRYMRPDLVAHAKRSPIGLLQISSVPGPGKVKVKTLKKTKWAAFFLKKLAEREDTSVTRETKGQKWSRTFFKTNESFLEEKIRNMPAGGDHWRVVDFKCVPIHLFGKGGLRDKARIDERKQITYEHALQISGRENTRSQFCLPTYFEEDPGSIGEEVSDDLVNQKLLDSDMKVLKVDFERVIIAYLDDKVAIN